MPNNKKQKENKPVIIDDLPEAFDTDDDPRCKHCGAPFNVKSSYDDEYCSEECMEADQDE